MNLKIKDMQNILKITAIAVLVVTLASCGGGNAAKDQKAALGDKKVELEKLKKEKAKVDDNIRKLEEEIAKLDPTASSVRKLVSIDTVTSQDFVHYVDLQGKIDAQNVAMVAPQGQGGVVKAVYVKQGQQVRKGQTILKLDDEIARQAVVQAQQGVSGAKAQYDLAQSVYERRKKLWEQNIGSEVQVLQAKAEADGALSQWNSAKAAVNSAQAQLNTTNITAEIGGTIDVVNVKTGEYFSPQSAGNPATGIRIVNASDLKVTVLVPENYISRISVGTPLQVVLPELNNRIIDTRVTVVSKLIDPTTRSFFVEGKVPADKDLRPNQTAVAKVQDYKSPNTIAVPANIVQSDEKGKYLFIAETSGAKTVARRRIVIAGEAYGGMMEIKSGLKAGEQIITEGYQTLYDGQAISTGK